MFRNPVELRQFIQTWDAQKKAFLEEYFYSKKDLLELIDRAIHFEKINVSFFKNLNILLSIINDTENWEKITFILELLNTLDNTDIETRHKTKAKEYLKSVIFVIFNQEPIKKYDDNLITYQDILKDEPSYLGSELIFFSNFVFAIKNRNNVLAFFTYLQTSYTTAQGLDCLPEFFTVMATSSPAINTRAQDLDHWAYKKYPNEISSTQPHKTIGQRFKDFMANHWKKILVCALLGSLLVVAGVFTAGIVPMIAVGLGVSVATAAGIGFGGAAVVGGLAGAGVGAIAGAVPTQQESGVKAFLSRHKWKILGALAVTLIIGGALTGGIIAVCGVGVLGGVLAACGTGVFATAGAIGAPLSATAATAIGTTAVTVGAATVGSSTGLVLGAVIDNKHSVNADENQNISPPNPAVFKFVKTKNVFDERPKKNNDQYTSSSKQPTV